VFIIVRIAPTAERFGKGRLRPRTLHSSHLFYLLLFSAIPRFETASVPCQRVSVCSQAGVAAWALPDRCCPPAHSAVTRSCLQLSDPRMPLSFRALAMSTIGWRSRTVLRRSRTIDRKSTVRPMKLSSALELSSPGFRGGIEALAVALSRARGRPRGSSPSRLHPFFRAAVDDQARLPFIWFRLRECCHEQNSRRRPYRTRPILCKRLAVRDAARVLKTLKTCRHARRGAFIFSVYASPPPFSSPLRPVGAVSSLRVIFQPFTLT